MVWWFLLLGAAAQWPERGEYVPDDRYPGIVEVDLIFPRNDTYGLAKSMPVIFTVQNPHLAEPLGLEIDWDIRRLGSWEEEDRIVKWGHLHPEDFEYSSNDTFFRYERSYGLRELEGTWELFWNISTNNCTETEAYGRVWRNSLVFSTKNGTQAPDPIAATGDSTCARSEGIVFNMTRTFTGWWTDERTCPELSRTTSAPSPCAIEMKPRDILNVSLEMAFDACHGWVYRPGYEHCDADPSKCSDIIYRLMLNTCTPNPYHSQGRALCSPEKLLWSTVALTWIIYHFV